MRLSCARGFPVSVGNVRRTLAEVWVRSGNVHGKSLVAGCARLKTRRAGWKTRRALLENPASFAGKSGELRWFYSKQNLVVSKCVKQRKAQLRARLSRDDAERSVERSWETATSRNFPGRIFRRGEFLAGFSSGPCRFFRRAKLLVLK